MLGAAIAAGVAIAVGMALLWTDRLPDRRQATTRKKSDQGSAGGLQGSTGSAAMPAARSPAGRPPQERRGERKPAAVSPALPPEPAPDALPTPPLRQKVLEGPVEIARAGERERRAPESAGREVGPAVTSGVVARIGRVEGRVMYARGARGKWAKAVPGVQLLAGDRIDTRAGMARLDLDGATVYANRATTLRVVTARTASGLAALVELSRGEVYLEDEGQQVRVATPDGLFTPVGTRFDVRRTAAATIVVVEAGEVKARARSRESLTQRAVRGTQDPRLKTSEVGSVTLGSVTLGSAALDLRRWDWVGKAVQVRAGQQSRVRIGSAPTPPKSVNPARSSAWMAAAFREVRVLCDFESPADLKMFVEVDKRGLGRLVPDHATRGKHAFRFAIRPQGQRCLKGSRRLGFPTDWRGFTHLALDVFNDTDRPVRMRFEFRDTTSLADWDKRRDHTTMLNPGYNAVRVRIDALQSNRRARTIDIAAIHALLMCLDEPAGGTLYLDNLRLERRK